MTIPWHRQFGLLWVVVFADSQIPRGEMVEAIRPMMKGTFEPPETVAYKAIRIDPERSELSPGVSIVEVSRGPFAGSTAELSHRYAMGVKWVARASEPERFDDMRGELLSRIRQNLAAQFSNVNATFKFAQMVHFGQTLPGNVAVPQTPGLPFDFRGIFGVIVGGTMVGVGTYVAER